MSAVVSCTLRSFQRELRWLQWLQHEMSFLGALQACPCVACSPVWSHWSIEMMLRSSWDGLDNVVCMKLKHQRISPTCRLGSAVLKRVLGSSSLWHYVLAWTPGT